MDDLTVNDEGLVTAFHITVDGINQAYPPTVSVPLYGYILPIIVAVTLITNSIIVVVNRQPSMRTPSNFILLAMAVAEVMTGLSSLPWYLYYYTMGKYSDEEHGLSPFWCANYRRFNEILPSLFHNTACWFAVLLASQRFAYIRNSQCIHNKPVFAVLNMKQVKRAVIGIPVGMFLLTLPKILYSTDYYRKMLNGIEICESRTNAWAVKLGDNVLIWFHWMKIFLFHVIPTVLLIVFSIALIREVKRVSGPMEQRRKGLKEQNHNRKIQFTRMLIPIIIIFALLEIPVAILILVQLGDVVYQLEIMPVHVVNYLIMIRNALILAVHPINFALYCGMSSQFRACLQHLFGRFRCLVPPPAGLAQDVITTTATFLNRRSSPQDDEQGVVSLRIAVENRISMELEGGHRTPSSTRSLVRRFMSEPNGVERESTGEEQVFV